ncbi:M13 family metallopeptidase [Companilactobacillus bobalius]|uniref:Neutral endopeptidase n=2 Tax=Companilactobacillus bobalius TaxID=2801451 RepID=A0A202F981_9LACO|nr:M13-type metalloendopeptidase [Companilactobacillus bobalius]KAE9561437.1 peptidase M13 [Companilactobacillus bobalius]KRK82329.1 neutral endopeptidase [Companilactobacillus bobalius DSM 19674]OVE96997.1 Neutral endopeptidase [Companilactobacillus bobalius]GEO59381.1 peptidase M13 [Companilactobacillus paralimentarius]
MLTSKIMGGAGDLTDGKETSYKDNLYLAVNGAWQEKAEVPADKSSAGASMDLDIKIEKELMDDFQQLAENESEVEGNEFLQAIKLYRLAKNTEFLKKLHEKPILNDLQRIEDLTSLQDLNHQLADFGKDNFFLPTNIWIDADMKDTKHNAAYVDGIDLILPDNTYYAEDNQSGKKLLAKYAKVANKLLTMVGYSEESAKEAVDKALAFDKSLVPIVKTSEEWAEYSKIYNPMPFIEFVTKSENIDLKQLVVGQINATPEKVIIVQPRFLKNLDKLVNNDTFENLKAWMLVRYLVANSEYLDEDFRQVTGEYELALSGAKELQNRTKFAYHLAEDKFDEVIGIYYGKKYFGEKAKADVRGMVERMIGIYKQRLTDNTWLSQATKDKAILKLNKIVIKVGYPDKIQEVFKQLKIDESQSLYNNITQIDRTVRQNELNKFSKPVDRTVWLMPGEMVNACYDPSRNDITFPAGILQAPFYSLQQTTSENFGGIGATFAHEISHAFDNDGAKFDEYGNMKNWWTKEDYAKFEKLTQQMIDQFNDIPFSGGEVNGKLVVSENIADVGGLRCAIEAAKMDADYSPKEFFITWAKSWRFKATPEYNERLLATDVHAPQPLRANVMSQDLDEFYDAFDVKPGDGMWLDEDKRINIW